MKSRDTSLSSSTTEKGPKVVGGRRPSTSARKVADLCLSRAATMVWLRWTGMRTPPAREAMAGGAKHAEGRCGTVCATVRAGSGDVADDPVAALPLGQVQV